MKKYVAEFIGTFFLVLFGCGTAVATGCKSSEANAAYLLTALAFGLVLAVLVYWIGGISGCHVNPAVSLGMLLYGKLSAGEFVRYLIAQFAGGICGALVLGGLAGWDCGFGANALYNGGAGRSFVIELILTFVFVSVVFAATAKQKNAAVSGLVIGMGLTLVHILGIHFTGTSVNPARSFGPALLAGGTSLTSVWVFIVAPLVGGALAALFRRYLFTRRTETD